MVARSSEIVKILWLATLFKLVVFTLVGLLSSGCKRDEQKRTEIAILRGKVSSLERLTNHYYLVSEQRRLIDIHTALCQQYGSLMGTAASVHVDLENREWVLLEPTVPDKFYTNIFVPKAYCFLQGFLSDEKISIDEVRRSLSIRERCKDKCEAAQ